MNRFFPYMQVISIFVLLLIWSLPPFMGQVDAATLISPSSVERKAPLSQPTADDSVLNFERWTSYEKGCTESVAWGDVNQDGYLDLAVGNSDGANLLYISDHGVLPIVASWVSNDIAQTNVLLWGDIDENGFLDLIAGNRGQSHHIYFNTDGLLAPSAIAIGGALSTSASLELADVDADGDLDLAGSSDQQPYTLYLNQSGTLVEATLSFPQGSAPSQQVRWTDINLDGLPDLLVADAASFRLYLNENGGLPTEANVSWPIPVDGEPGIEYGAIQDFVWGDMDNDGDTELAVSRIITDTEGILRSEGYLYLNQSGILSETNKLTWAGFVHAMTWGDVDNDGDADLLSSLTGDAGGNNGDLHLNIKLNSNGLIHDLNNKQFIADTDLSNAIALGDADNDGDLDVAVGNCGNPNRVYYNQLPGFDEATSFFASQQQGSSSMAWGDVDRDGDLDLAIGYQTITNSIHLNNGGIIEENPTWSTTEVDNTSSMAWGDLNNDGLLDLAVGNLQTSNRIYFNLNGELEESASWAFPVLDSTTSIALGDINNDDFLDLAIGNQGESNRVYLNANGGFSQEAYWSSTHLSATTAIAWGDVDNDGDLDLAIGNENEPNQLYLNQRGVLDAEPIWESQEADATTSMAWGDIDRDGDIELVVGNLDQPNRIYFNLGGRLENSASWSSAELDPTVSIGIGDISSDGDLDIASANSRAIGCNNPLLTGLNCSETVLIYENKQGTINNQAYKSYTAGLKGPKTVVSWVDVDNNGTTDLAVKAASQDFTVLSDRYIPTDTVQTIETRVSAQLLDTLHSGNNNNADPLPPANAGYSVGNVRGGIIPFQYTIHHGGTQAINEVRGWYSLNGGGHWVRAKATPATITTGFTTPTGNNSMATTYIFEWDVNGSDFFGQSDNVIFRIEVGLSCANNCRRTSIYAQTYPFRARGTQIQVLDQSNAPVLGARIYQFPVGGGNHARPFTDLADEFYETDEQGYLQGRGRLAVGDGLVALKPVIQETKFTLFETSASPIVTGLDLTNSVVNDLAIQTLNISPDNPLILFNLDVALEWDARNDLVYLEQLEADLRRSSTLLYDWTNGQAAVGKITVYQNKENWLDADVRVYATNQLRPHATIGGIVPSSTLYTVTVNSETQTILYGPGHVEMGATWNRYGNVGDNLSDDWARTLSHELGHYLLYLFDNYIGIAENRIIQITDCPGVMSDPYTELNSEFHPTEGWETHCLDTLSNQIFGRSDWETINAFYPALNAPTGPIDAPSMAGPNNLPLAVTQIQFSPIITEPTTIEVPTFLLNKDSAPYIASDRARSFLFQGSNERLIDLGSPRRDRVQAWNANIGDRLCTYDLSALPEPIAGCVIVSDGNTDFPIVEQSNWQPDLILEPNSYSSLKITVTNLPSGISLRARLYPADEQSSDLAYPDIALNPESDSYVGVMTVTEIIQAAYLYIYDQSDSSRTRSFVSDYTVGGAPVLSLGGGDVLSLGGGNTLIRADGTSVPLSEGDLLTVSGGSVLIRYGDGRIEALSDGDSLALASGNTLTPMNGAPVNLQDGDVLSLGGGNVRILRSNGDVLSLGGGDVLSLGGGNGVVLTDGYAGIVNSLNEVLSLGGGDVLSLGGGNVLSLGGGNVLLIGGGDVLSLGGGDVLSLGGGDVLSLGGGNVDFISAGDVLSLGGGNAPVRSSDGQVTIFADSRDFEPNEFYTVQPATVIPTAPNWTTVIGQPYRVTASTNAPALSEASISINYLGRNVNDDDESLLHVYYFNGTTWIELPTDIDTYHNRAVADAQGPGIYALMYSIDIPLSDTGWNLIAYPLAQSSPMPSALDSITGTYTTVYGYDAFEPDPFQRWEQFDTTAPAWVNDLVELTPGRGYWINASANAILKLQDVSAASVDVHQLLVPTQPPATYYGQLIAHGDFNPLPGMMVEAWKGNTVCGQAISKEIDEQVVYVVNVYAAGSDFAANCGQSGDSITFSVDGRHTVATTTWNNTQVAQLDLSLQAAPEEEQFENYLPWISQR